MATLTITGSISQSDMYVSCSINNNITLTNVRKSEKTMSIPTTAAGTALTLGDVVTPRYCYAFNMEATGGNFVEIGNQTTGTFYPLLRLEPQRGFPFIIGVSPYARADTGAVKLYFVICDA